MQIQRRAHEAVANFFAMALLAIFHVALIIATRLQVASVEFIEMGAKFFTTRLLGPYGNHDTLEVLFISHFLLLLAGFVGMILLRGSVMTKRFWLAALCVAIWLQLWFLIGPWRLMQNWQWYSFELTSYFLVTPSTLLVGSWVGYKVFLSDCRS